MPKQTEIKRYLIDERKIDPRLVNWLIKKDLIAQDKKNNVVFKWREEGGKGQVIGMNRQGTVKMENKREALSKLSRIMKKSMLVLRLMWVSRIRFIFMKINRHVISLEH